MNQKSVTAKNNKTAQLEVSEFKEIIGLQRHGVDRGWVKTMEWTVHFNLNATVQCLHDEGSRH